MAFESKKNDPNLESSAASAADDSPSVPYPGIDLPDNGDKPELLGFLASLPDVDLPAPPETAPDAEPDEAETEPEKSEEELKVEALAERIRSRTKASQVTAYSLLLSEDSDINATFERLFADEAYSDIVHTAGQRDTYYYSSAAMTANYATIAVLVEEKDLAYTVAHMTRFNCKTYPAPTPMAYFMRHPYGHSKPQMERIREVMKRDPAYGDIEEVVTANGQVYFYSSESMSQKYALSLAERAEYREEG